MCRVEERVYISPGGNSQVFEIPFPCHKGRPGKLCSRVEREIIEYRDDDDAISRDDTSSPASYNPPTPTTSGSYLVQTRRPSVANPKSSTRHDTKVLKPEVVIKIGSSKDKKDKYKYTSRSAKRTSLGAASIGSSDVAVESPGSEASYTIRTGLPETPILTGDHINQPATFNTRTAVPQGHRQSSSTSSFTTSSQPPSLYATSEPDSPTIKRPARYPPTIVHNPPPPSPPVSRGPKPGPAPAPAPSSPSYRTVAPQHHASRETFGSTGSFPLDYSDILPSSNSSNASSSRAAAPEITDRNDARARLRAENRKRQQEEDDRKMAEAMEAENKRQVRFQIDRDAQKKEGERLEAKEKERQRKSKEQEERDAKEARKIKEEMARKEKQAEETKARDKKSSRPPVRDPTKRTSRRPSISQSAPVSLSQEIQAKEREILLMETAAIMAREREATELREQNERAAALKQQQQTSQYWDPRGGDRYAVPNDGPGVGRRASVSGRRSSVSSPPSMGLSGASGHRRVSVVQNAPPQINPQYSMRPPSSHHQNPPPPSSLYSPTSAPQSAYSSVPPSARGSASSWEDWGNENPFAAPAAPARPPQTTTHDPWNNQDLHSALPTQSQPTSVHQRQQSSDEHQHTLRRRGEEVINRAAQDRSRHHGARQATRTLGKVAGYEDDYESSSENEADKIAGYGPNLGLNKGRKRRT